MNDTVITIVGNLTAEPELRQTQSGVAVASFTIASTPRTFDRQANEWKDGEALFLRCSVWRELATNAAASLSKGMRVVAQGRLQQRAYQDREGNDRTSIELQVDEIGPSLRYATAQVTRGDRGGGSYGGAAPIGGAASDAGAPGGGSGPAGGSGGDQWAASGGDWSQADDTPF